MMVSYHWRVRHTGFMETAAIGKMFALGNASILGKDR